MSGDSSGVQGVMKVCALYHRDFDTFPRANKQIDTLANQDDVKVVAIGHKPGTNEQFSIGDATVRHRTSPVELPDVHVFKILVVIVGLLTILTAGWKEDADVYHCIGVYALLAGVVLRPLRQATLTYDVPEEYGFQVRIAFPGLGGAVLGTFVRRLENLAVRFVAVVFTVNSSDDVPYNRLANRNGNTHLLENVPRLSEFDIKNDENPLAEYDDRSVLLYVGNVQEEKGGTKMIETMRHVATEHPKALLFVIGGGTDSYMNHLQELVEQYGLSDNVVLNGPVDYDQVNPYLANADIAVQIYQPGLWTSRSMASSSVFRYMGFGLPLVVSDLPGMGQQVRTYECGVTAPPDDEEAIAAEISKLLTNPELANELGKRGRQLVEERYNWSVEKERFLEEMEPVLEANI